MMRRRERGKTLQQRLDERLPLVVKTALKLMHSDNPSVRAQARAAWRLYGPLMVRDLERLRLRDDRLAETPKARHRDKRPQEAS